MLTDGRHYPFDQLSCGPVRRDRHPGSPVAELEGDLIEQRGFSVSRLSREQRPPLTAKGIGHRVPKGPR